MKTSEKTDTSSSPLFETRPPGPKEVLESSKALSASPRSRSEKESRVKELANDLRNLARRNLKTCWELGRTLQELRDDTEHGSWEKYVRGTLGIHPRTASNYLKLAREVPSIEALGVLMKSESVSDLGVREALDLLSSRSAKLATSTPIAAKKVDGTDVPGERPASETRFSLADQSDYDFKAHGWQDGLISESRLRSRLQHPAANQAGLADTKSTARLQRFVIELAMAVNRSCGRADQSNSVRVAHLALEELKALLPKPNSAE